mgnify:CR=1 FL=1
MIKVVIFSKDDLLRGFEIRGHSTTSAEDMDGKLVCAAVSSATILTANTVTEIIGDNAQVETDDGYLKLFVDDAEECAVVLNGLHLHLCELQKEYPNKIKVIMEVEP